MIPDLPKEVVRQIDAIVESLGGLEVVIRICREPGRLWTEEGLAAELRVPPHVVGRTLARMRASGLVQTQRTACGLRVAVRVAPERVALAAAVVEIHANRRVDLVNHVACRALQRVQAIADRLRHRRPSRDRVVSDGGESRHGHSSGLVSADRLQGALPGRR